MAVDIKAVTNAALDGASAPIIENLLNRMGIKPKDSKAAAGEITAGKPAEQVLAPYQGIKERPVNINLWLGVFGIAVAAVFIYKKGKSSN